MISIGIQDQYVDTVVPQCNWTIDGKVTFNGPLKMARGSYVLVAKNAELTLGTNRTYIGSNIKILCFKKITIGDSVRIAWDCQIYDSSFHYVEKTENGEIGPLAKEVFIGDRIWLGNKSTVSKGAVIPSDTIVASNSLVNKDFSSIAPYTMIAGIPARPKATGLRRAWSLKDQKDLDDKYGYKRHLL